MGRRNSDFGKELLKFITETWRDTENGSPKGQNRWEWVSNEVNLAFWEELPEGMSGNACRKMYDRHNKGTGKTKTVKPEQEEKEYRLPRSGVVIKNPGNVLIISDTHIPFEMDGYFEFIKATVRKHKIDTVMHIGDVVDAHALSFWDHDPDGMSAGDEIRMAKKSLKKWGKAFPGLRICLGNHDLRPARKMHKAGLPAAFMRSWNDIYGTPNSWKWNHSYILDYGEGVRKVYITHGAKGGKYAAMQKAAGSEYSVVIGHTHIFGGASFVGNGKFAMNVGCGYDKEKYAFNYAKAYDGEGVLGCGVILGNGTQPMFVPFVN